MRSSEKLELLREVITRRAPALVGLLVRVGDEPLSQDERNALREAVTDEFAEHGLQADHEPNAYGLRMEELVDWLGVR